MNLGINMNTVFEAAKLDRLALVFQTLSNVFDEKVQEGSAFSRNDLERETERRLVSVLSTDHIQSEAKASTRVTADSYCLNVVVRIPALGSTITAFLERDALNGKLGQNTSITVREKR